MADPGRFIRWTHSTAPQGCKYLLFLISHPQEVGAQDVDIQTRKDRQTEATTHTRCQWSAATLEWSGSEKQHQSADLSCLLSGCCWRRNGVGDIFLTHFGPLSRNWLLFRHTDDKHTPVRPRGAIFWWRTTQHDTKSESSEAAFLNMTSSSFPNRLKSHRVSIQCVATWRPHHKSAANKTGWCCQYGLKCQQGCLSDSLKLWHKWSRRIKWLQWWKTFLFYSESKTIVFKNSQSHRLSQAQRA